MLIEIKHRWSGTVLFSGEYESSKAAVEAIASTGANLSRAHLSGADLVGAHLVGADLVGADLVGADLSRANLFRADLVGADLSGADLSRANLFRADLSRADLSGADLVGADLSGAHLVGADLVGADLVGIVGCIAASHELLAAVAIRFDQALIPVAAMLAGRLVGCWPEYTTAIRACFGEEVMRRLWEAWAQEGSWGVVEKLKQYGWPEPTADED